MTAAGSAGGALLGLMAAGEAEHPSVDRGIAYLIERQDPDGTWNEPWSTAVGFPRVFYLRDHGYAAFFPLWALAHFHHLSTGNSRGLSFGL
jgi:squalene-hopene/tetraprenyl-beta-curcumene cyclase